ncbi:MAG: GntR family transcriptional regulator [Novosphingobium sp.]|nr:GntR family transcriptional regulator [Novosphingobium sp.]
MADHAITDPLREIAAPRRNLVATTTDRLREMVFAVEPGAQIGSLSELARVLGVGIVTVQQAARILEHEGLLDVRRGPGGGYYGRRPDEATLERSLAAYMRMHRDSLDEALDVTSLLFIELCAAAARCNVPQLREELSDFAEGLADCADAGQLGVRESELQDLLFRMVDRPLFELLTRVTLRFATMSGGPDLYRGPGGIAGWIAGRQRIIAAIVAGDEALARFEADRSNRQVLLAWLRRKGEATSP